MDYLVRMFGKVDYMDIAKLEKDIVDSLCKSIDSDENISTYSTQVTKLAVPTALKIAIATLKAEQVRKEYFKWYHLYLLKNHRMVYYT